MKAIDTALKAAVTAGFTGTVFALPLVLAMVWQSIPSVDDVEVVAAPMVAIAALPLALAPEEGALTLVEDEGSDAAEAGPAGSDAVADGAATPRPEGPMRATRSSRPTVASKASSPPADAPRSGSKKKRPCETPNPGIERLESGTWNVERDIVDAYAKKPSSLSSLGWASVAEASDGRNLGFKVGGIQCGNDLHAAGLRNGDIVQAVNGKPVRNIPEAIWAYSSLRKADVIELRIQRKGEERTLTYRLG